MTLDTVAKNGWDILSHPLYSPDFASSEDHLFRILKDCVRGQHCENDDTAQEAVLS